MKTVGFWGYLCARQRWITLGHALVWVTLLLNTVSLVAVETTARTEVVIAMNYFGMIPALIVSGFILYKCKYGGS